MIGNPADPAWKIVPGNGKAEEINGIRYSLQSLSVGKDSFRYGLKSYRNHKYIFGDDSKLLVKNNVSFDINKAVQGQNNNNPFAVFQNHALVYIDGTLFDPSYGVSYSGKLEIAVGEFQAKSIQLFASMDQKNNKFWFRVPGINIELKITPIQYPTERK